MGRLPAEPPQNIAEPDKLFATWEQFVDRLQEGRVPGADDLALSITKLQQQLSGISEDAAGGVADRISAKDRL